MDDWESLEEVGNKERERQRERVRREGAQVKEDKEVVVCCSHYSFGVVLAIVRLFLFLLLLLVSLLLWLRCLCLLGGVLSEANQQGTGKWESQEGTLTLATCACVGRRGRGWALRVCSQVV